MARRVAGRRFTRRAGAAPVRFERGAAITSSPLAPLGQEPFGVDRRHATGPGRRDGLPVDVILDIARRENPGDARLRSLVSDQIAVLVHVEDTAEEVAVRAMADPDEEPLHI